MLRLSSGERAHGTIKASAEDFIVEEITEGGIPLKLDTDYTPSMLGLQEEPEGKFASFVLQKTNWNTVQALKLVSSKLGRGVRSVGFAGTKDRTAKSTQLCSIFGVDPQALMRVHAKDIKINGAWRSGKKVELGELSGNRFEIVVRDIDRPEIISDLEQSLNQRFPNYFGGQRFGSRNNNPDVGADILKGDFKGAVMHFLTDTNNENNEEATEARKRLTEEQDFKAALEYFPQYLKYERSVIEYLSRFENNYANAIRRLPRSISLMFVHSVEDMIFNKEAEKMIKEGHAKPIKGDNVCPPDEARFYDIQNTRIYDPAIEVGNEFIVLNVLGYETRDPTDFEKEEMEKLELTLESFKAKGLQELNCKGAKRVLLAPYKNFECSFEQTSARIKFSLPAGSYATVFLEQLVESRSGA
jgi:tRNA pseudouridine13 synthase